LIIRDDNTFEILIDQTSKASGSLLKDFLPAVNPPTEIDDPEDKKPADWVDETQIPEPNAVKPDDWDEDAPFEIPDENAVKPEGWLDSEPELVADPDSEKPVDWDEEEDGEYEAPQIPNPKCASAPGCGVWTAPMMANPEYKGKWTAPMIDNPAYKGEWAPRKIANPSYFEDKHPARMPSIGAVAIEVWTMSGGINFDNFWIGHDAKAASRFAELTWAKEHELEMLEEKKTSESEKEKIREEKLEAGGFMNLLSIYASDGMDLVRSQPMVFLGLVITFFVMMFLLCGRSKKDTVGERKKNDDADETEQDVDDEAEEVEEEEEEEEEKEEKTSTRQRKRAPKAD
jgi:calnexin